MQANNFCAGNAGIIR